MTQTLTPTAPNAWLQALQLKLMAALDAAWSLIDGDADPAAIRQARDKAKAIGELAAVARKVGQILPAARKPAADTAEQAVADVGAMTQALAPVAAQAEHARRALDRLKGGGRARL